MKICVICVGNELMLDDGLGIEVYRQMEAAYELPAEIDLVSAGCMTLDMIERVNAYDLIISVDAIDGTGAEAGTIFRYTPDDVARRGTPMGSLHELKLADLFDAAELLGYSADGLCFGMRVLNMAPVEFAPYLTPVVEARVPFFAECVVAALVQAGHEVLNADGSPVTPG